MYRIVTILFVASFFSGCVSTPSQNTYTQIEKRQQERAKEHLTDLYLKKQRFFERQILASANDYTGQLKHADCTAMATGSWGESVMYGQNFLEYENHVSTVERCFNK